MEKQSKLFPGEDPVVLNELKLDEATKIACEVQNKVHVWCEELEVVGSIRRQKCQVHDVDFVVVAQDSGWLKIFEELRKLKTKTICSGKAVTKTLYPYGKDYFQVDFYRATPSTFGIHKLIRTGSAEHNTWLASYAISKGMRLRYSEGLMQDGKVIAGSDEAEVFKALGLEYIEPTQREISNGTPIWMTQ